MKNWFKKLTSNAKSLFFLACFDLFVFICFVPFAFFNTESGYWLGSLMLGWLLGCFAQILGYISIIFTSKVLGNINGTSTLGTLFGGGGFFIRYILYAGVLAISAISTFKPEWFGGFNCLNFFTCFSSIVVLSFFLMIYKIIEMKNESKQTEKEEASK